MGITLSNLSKYSNIFTEIIDSDDFVEKIFTVTSSIKNNPLHTDNLSKQVHANSLESIDSGYENDFEDINQMKSLSPDEFKDRVNKLKGRLYKYYASFFINEQSTDAIIKKNRPVLEKFKEMNEELYGYANFSYRYVKIPELDINNQQKRNEIIENFTLPKSLTSTNNSKIPLKTQPIKAPLNKKTFPSESVRYKKKTNFHKELVYINYKTSEKNQKAIPLPKSNFEFKGNVQQTKASLLRTQRIKEQYHLSNQSDSFEYNVQKHPPRKNRVSIKKNHLISLNNNIKKEQKLTKKMNEYLDSIKAIQSQIDNNNQLLAILKS
ncbi:MAG TPA: hypothetical protein DD649_19980 [Providencia sp.]|uniref:hypothetical protein n=1 Tax=Providencia sp. TaxID=589 RepID=UPI000E7E2FEF|nr:hypothetical protein [Providencia sp.]HBO25143.1 hypothetical protein [Providencia sp.]